MSEENKKTDLAMSGGMSSGSATALESSIDVQNPDIDEQSSSKLDSALGNLDLLRQVILVLSVSICVALIVMLFFWVQEPEMRPLGMYETDELIQVLDHLDAQKSEYKLDGNTILVPASSFSKLKLDLSRAGLNKSVGEGDDILLQDMGFGVSQRLEQERLKLSRERQLASTFEQMRPIRKAQVLLAMPKQSVFVRHNQEASATVFLTMRMGASLRQEEVDSIVDMVSSAVPGMKPTRITVTDQHGRLLSSGSQDPMAMAHRKEQELERKQEQTLRDKIDAILIPVLGLGNYTAQVDVSMDFSAIEQTRKQFDPQTPSTRSEYTLEDYNNGNVIAGVPGALSNQPPVDSAIPQDIAELKDGSVLGQGSVHKEATRNFELDTTISHERKQSGTVARQTVSVAIKERQSINPDTGEVTYTPIAAEQLEKIRQIIIGSVGLNEQRGDLLNVLSVKFAIEEQPIAIDVPIWENPNFNDWIKWLAGALVIIAVLLILVRPAMNKLLFPEQAANDNASNGEGNSDGDMGLIGSDLDSDGFEFGSGIDLPNLHKDEDLLKAVRALVANEPELAAQVVKNWVSENG
ncbi:MULTISPECIES: flagellar basal-body MS-ring/collar protein FliF [unclassified Aliivibrio]|uniref:flagellar basal-body MS-ring/collar protein FliF n=1 Tax=unclassified Aliivibrio TaxID=2645654 RepID=UPI00080E74C9|nr:MULTISPECIES: flagellar basal-body MS-ring/collar protein FliF [unclassified Aliivibrio]OCH12877.1 flagellar M-ring protein FliF [Aliivibrio sp. 1S165]OCH16250.1 flagellar M-ring protein FliF [Aliivibrio sp. 1S128]OCH28434.1 flagellar M-ring protein FliF [Aliivibrio sp. 1S175]